MFTRIKYKKGHKNTIKNKGYSLKNYGLNLNGFFFKKRVAQWDASMFFIIFEECFQSYGAHLAVFVFMFLVVVRYFSVTSRTTYEDDLIILFRLLCSEGCLILIFTTANLLVLYKVAVSYYIYLIGLAFFQFFFGFFGFLYQRYTLKAEAEINLHWVLEFNLRYTFYEWGYDTWVEPMWDEWWLMVRSILVWWRILFVVSFFLGYSAGYAALKGASRVGSKQIQLVLIRLLFFVCDTSFLAVKGFSLLLKQLIEPQQDYGLGRWLLKNTIRRFNSWYMMLVVSTGRKKVYWAGGKIKYDEIKYASVSL